MSKNHSTNNSCKSKRIQQLPRKSCPICVFSVVFRCSSVFFPHPNGPKVPSIEAASGDHRPLTRHLVVSSAVQTGRPDPSTSGDCRPVWRLGDFGARRLLSGVADHGRSVLTSEGRLDKENPRSSYSSEPKLSSWMSVGNRRKTFIMNKFPLYVHQNRFFSKMIDMPG